MGSTESKVPSNPVLARLEHEAVRGAIPRGLKDERSRQLEYELNWCLTRNNWYFTAGGLLVGGALGLAYKSVQPIAWAAILSPAADWLYERQACAEIQEAYVEHQKKLLANARQAAEHAKEEVREQFERYMNAGGPDAGGPGAGGPDAGGPGAGAGAGSQPAAHGGASGGSGNGFTPARQR